MVISVDFPGMLCYLTNTKIFTSLHQTYGTYTHIQSAKRVCCSTNPKLLNPKETKGKIQIITPTVKIAD